MEKNQIEKCDTYEKNTENENQWTLIISADKYSIWADLKELRSYRELIAVFVKRDIKTMYAQTILGPVWFIITAVLSSSIFTFLFGEIAGFSTDGVPQFLFYMFGTILWSLFSSCLSKVSGTFLGYSGLMGKIYFPRLCTPISQIISRLVPFGIQLIIFLAVYLYYMLVKNSVSCSGLIAAVPLLLLEILALALGCGLILTSLTVRYRDIMTLITYALQIWMYITPVMYPVSQLPEKWRWFLLLNPIGAILETMRCICFNTGDIPAAYLVVSWFSTALILGIGGFAFQRTQRKFIDTI